MLIALYALQLLPINYVGFSLLILGLLFIIAEGFTSSFGILGLGGSIAFVLGSVMLINTNELGYKIAWFAIALTALLNVCLIMLVAGAVLRTRNHTVRNGLVSLVGAQGRTLQAINLEGQAVINGEIWNVQAKQAMQLRYLQTLAVIAGTNNSTIVFPMPMELGEILAGMVKK